jgi:hypothetical protein
VQDASIMRFARSVARFDGVVYMRFAHEMNGYWSPRSHGPAAYVPAWRRMGGCGGCARGSGSRWC